MREIQTHTVRAQRPVRKSEDRPGLDVKGILRELEVPFSPDQVHWRVTVTANDRKRGQIVPYADPVPIPKG